MLTYPLEADHLLIRRFEVGDWGAVARVATQMLLMGAFLCCLGCTSSPKISLWEGTCRENEQTNGTDLALQDGSEKFCVVGLRGEPLVWELSADQQRLAYAVLNPKGTVLPMDGRNGYYQPLATTWYIINFDTKRESRLPEADNLGIELSPDGSYVQVVERCYYEKCPVKVYQTDTRTLVCSYTSWALGYTDGTCPTLTLANGEPWSIEDEVKAGACEYYQNLDVHDARCLTSAPASQPSDRTEGYP